LKVDISSLSSDDEDTMVSMTKIATTPTTVRKISRMDRDEELLKTALRKKSRKVFSPK